MGGQRYYGRAGRALAGTIDPVACAYDPWIEFSHRHELHVHTRRHWLPFLRRCVRPPACQEDAVVCVWWDSPYAGYYEAPVCARHLALATEQNLLVGVEAGVERGQDGQWRVLAGAMYEESG